MGQSDLGQIDYFDNNIRFADLYNGILFNGETVIKSEELEPCDSTFVQLFQNQKGKKVFCDKIRTWKGQHLAILPIESQSKVDYRMVLRVIQLLFEILSNRNNKEKIKQIFDNECENYKLDLDAATALTKMADLEVNIENLKVIKNGKVEYKMCKAIEEIKEDARDEGYKSGIEATMHNNVKSLMETMHLTLEQALDALKITDEDRKIFYS